MTDVLMMGRAGQNPFIALLTEGLVPGFAVAEYRPPERPPSADILHAHWPENLFRQSSLRDLARAALVWGSLEHTIKLVRRRGALVWTAHNLERHEPLGPWLRRPQQWQLRRFFARVDIAVAMSAEQIPQLRAAFPDVRADRWRVAPHPHYRSTYRNSRPRPETRALLGIPESATLAVMFGKLRPYKGVPEAISRFRAAARMGEVLVVAGGVSDPALRREIEAAAAGTDAVRLRFGDLSELELASLLRAADLSIFNFSRILNSGSLLAALSLDCPVLAPRNPGFEDLARNVGDPGWINLFDGPLTAGRIRSSLDRAVGKRPPGSPDLDGHSVEAVGEAYRKIYEEALELRRRELA